MFSERASASFVTDQKSQGRQIGSDFFTVEIAGIGSCTENTDYCGSTIVGCIGCGRHIFFYRNFCIGKSFGKLIGYLFSIIGRSATGSVKKNFFDMIFKEEQFLILINFL